MEVDRRSYSRRRMGSDSDLENSRVSTSKSRNSPRKRSYQRERNPMRSRQPCEDEKALPIIESDLRSPCHKQPRFKGEKENTPQDKTPINHRWSKARVDGENIPWRQKSPLNNNNNNNKKDELILFNSDFPPLGFDDEKYTPESTKDWGSIVEDEERQMSQGKQPPKFKRRLLLSDSQESNTKKCNKKQNNDAKPIPTIPRPILTDIHKLDQRQKQIDIGKNTVAYGRYMETTFREQRRKEDPWTPDKFQQCSTRSWVGQIKVWRRRLHSWDPPTDSQEDLFSVSSTSSSQATEETKMEVEETDVDTIKSTPSSTDELFSGFDLDSCLMDDGFPL